MTQHVQQQLSGLLVAGCCPCHEIQRDEGPNGLKPLPAGGPLPGYPLVALPWSVAAGAPPPPRFQRQRWREACLQPGSSQLLIAAAPLSGGGPVAGACSRTQTALDLPLHASAAACHCLCARPPSCA
eukprot:359437-Chlamydomonas_euryale.AAC.5